MLNEKVIKLLNEQINKEFFSAYLYLDISNYYQEQGLDGFSSWYKIQAQEERDHAMLILQYLQNNGAKVVLSAIDQPNTNFSDVLTPAKAALAHEEFVTESIHIIYDKAHQLKDFRTVQFLDWFVKEQGEEEATADAVIKKIELFGSDPKGLYLLNQELATRVYTAPSLVL